MSSLWDKITSAGKILMNPLASITGSVLESRGQTSANKANIDIMREQQEWQKMMSDTAHQREVKDLIASGINPIMTATGGKGASSGAVTSAKSENVMAGKGKVSTEMLEALSRIKLNKTNSALTAQMKETEGQKTIETAYKANSAKYASEILESQVGPAQLKGGRRETNTGQFLDWTKEYLDTVNPFRKRRQ